MSGRTHAAPAAANGYARPRAWLWTQMLLDSSSWVVALLLSLFLRYEMDFGLVHVSGMVTVCLVAIAAQLTIGGLFALYRGRYSFGSFDEAKALLLVTVTVTLLVQIVLLFVGVTLRVPRSIGLIAFPFALLFMAAARYLKRMYVESKSKPSEHAPHAVIYGAGFLANTLIAQMLQDKQSPYLPVALVDDDPAKKHLRINSVPVSGNISTLRQVVRRNGASVVIIAMADVDPALVERINAELEGLDVRILTAPPLKDLFGNTQGSSLDLRDVSLEDIVGQRAVDINVEGIARYVTGKRVLITGAGGSIGSELCRQIDHFAPSELIMLDRDESAVQATQLSITGRGLLDGPDTVLADIRDPEAMHEVFATRKPQVVFHAAALKHVSLLEQYPDEAWKTNVLGTRNVLRASAEVDVEVFVNISTDKAANPTTVLGHSKRMAEKMTAWMGHHASGRYNSVRFGNVFGSRGSMLPLFTEQIRRGGPVTVTHPEATRYFMTIPEACQLVIQAGAIGDPGEVLILDMGQPVRIYDIAQHLIRMSGRHDVEIEITGLRPGEKIHEDLIGEGERGTHRGHPQISHTLSPQLDPEHLDRREWKARGGMPPSRELPLIVPPPEADADADEARGGAA
ncbi:polysaccharide biosynthesis protein [Rothia sp. AR01]|uniref:Polysaccharide biosynthesis protein n=1 Tax=Rothia santali TaxID=2949643 RepID=A0A9X2HAC6_9MICC|nr:nucleoside-diphosphate sugar epimerase/dehydratase [Rothia santali]MCP3425954.1 polysaccharide biosynthesis protein [Rothia santali]